MNGVPSIYKDNNLGNLGGGGVLDLEYKGGTVQVLVASYTQLKAAVCEVIDHMDHDTYEKDNFSVCNFFFLLI